MTRYNKFNKQSFWTVERREVDNALLYFPEPKVFGRPATFWYCNWPYSTLSWWPRRPFLSIIALWKVSPLVTWAARYLPWWALTVASAHQWRMLASLLTGKTNFLRCHHVCNSHYFHTSRCDGFYCTPQSAQIRLFRTVKYLHCWGWNSTPMGSRREETWNKKAT